MFRLLCVGLVFLQLSACSIFPDKIEDKFNVDEESELYQNTNWTFWGRIAITDKKKCFVCKYSLGAWT